MAAGKNHFHAVHYRLIGDHFARITADYDDRTAVDFFLSDLADLFEEDNGRFDRERFLAGASGAPTCSRDVIDLPPVCQVPDCGCTGYAHP